MRPKHTLALLVLAVAGTATLALTGMVACPLSHDDYETNRPCWDGLDCVSNEMCGKPDGGELYPGKCGVPSDGPCLNDAGAGPGFFCFRTENGTAQSCYYDPHDRCTQCGLDGGIPDGGCPEANCLEWRDRWGCR